MRVQRERVNDMIRITPVRVIGPNDEPYGVMETIEAKKMARDAGLDLVEVSPHSRPPVCRIMDFGKYKYQQSKKKRKQRAGATKNELKEVRLGRSMRIDTHDIEMRVNQARQFLMDGQKVQFIQPFQGREMQHKQLGFERMKGIEESLSDIAKVEFPARFNGRRLIMIVAPDRAKISAIMMVRKQKEREKEIAEEKAKACEEGGTQAAEEQNGENAESDVVEVEVVEVEVNEVVEVEETPTPEAVSEQS